MVYTLPKAGASKNKSDETTSKNKSECSDAKSAADDATSPGGVGKPPLRAGATRATSTEGGLPASTLISPESSSCLSTTSPSAAATTSQEKIAVCCSKCGPIYQRQGQVTLTLDPARLLQEVNRNHAGSQLPRSQPKTTDKMALSPCPARSYGSLCACAESGKPDPRCAYHQASKWQLCLPRNKPWWPALKRCLLVAAALIPIVFLIVYIVLHQLWKK